MKRTRFSAVPLATVKDLQTAIANGNAAHASFDARITALQNAIATLTPGITIIALAEGSTVAILLGASADVTLPLSRTMPDTTYSVEPPRLGTATFVVKTKTTTAITFTITATGLAISAGQPLVAAAWK